MFTVYRYTLTHVLAPLLVPGSSRDPYLYLDPFSDARRTHLCGHHSYFFAPHILHVYHRLCRVCFDEHPCPYLYLCPSPYHSQIDPSYVCDG